LEQDLLRAGVWHRSTDPPALRGSLKSDRSAEPVDSAGLAVWFGGRDAAGDLQGFQQAGEDRRCVCDYVR
jgi:hypothetical protein